MKYSIIIPAFKVASFIESCIASIINITSNLEILIGVDGCRETLSKLNGIIANYPQLQIFYFMKNQGPFIIRNTLVGQSNADYLIFFDADDIMLPYFIKWCDQYYDNTIIITKFINKRIDINGELIINNNSPQVTSGVFGIRHSSFDNLGGFMPWPIRGDIEFIRRAIKSGMICAESIEPGFLWRKHPGSLTQRDDTGYGSKLRTKYKIKTKKIWNIKCNDKIRRVDADFKLIGGQNGNRMDDK